MEIIKDGSGRGYLAGVDEHNRLQTISTSRGRISFISEEHELAFMVYAKRNFLVSGTNVPILSFTYNGTTTCFIDSITFSTDSSVAKIELYTQHVYNSGGTDRSPKNLNLASSITSSVTSLIGVSGAGGELSLTYVDENEILDVRLGSGQPTFTYNFNGALILKRGDRFCMVGEVASPGDKIRAAVFYFEETS